MTKTKLKVAIEAALAAGKIQLAHYGRLKGSEIRFKSRNDFVTKVDKACEDKIIRIIRRHFPEHGFLAEESGETDGRGTYWIIDPLDGTSNYVHRFPMFAVSIGVYTQGQIEAAVVYDALHKELFTAEKGKGAYLNGKRIHVSKIPALADAMMGTGIPFRARNRWKQYIRSLNDISLASAGLRRGGSAALDLAYVACGRFEGFWEIDLSPWDIAAGALLIKEAGGRVSDMWGRGQYLQSGDVLASNSLIHGELQKLTSQALKPVKIDKMRGL
jgi:myo-inositol-1(or 4)-monophosphatase